MRKQANVERARAMVGCKFRPQGRDPATGLDCVGLVLAAFAIPPGGLRRDYRLRGDHGDELKRAILVHFTRSRGQGAAGELMLCQVAPDQLHLAINCGSSFVHADAGIGRIVETPGTPPWPIIATYRRRARPTRKR